MGLSKEKMVEGKWKHNWTERMGKTWVYSRRLMEKKESFIKHHNINLLMSKFTPEKIIKEYDYLWDRFCRLQRNSKKQYEIFWKKMRLYTFSCFFAIFVLASIMFFVVIIPLVLFSIPNFIVIPSFIWIAVIVYSSVIRKERNALGCIHISPPSNHHKLSKYISPPPYVVNLGC